MKYFRLGKYNVSQYCLGTWSLGSNKKKNISYGLISNSEISKILEYSFNKGINFFDTANVYGDSEEKIGNFFYKKRDKVFFATKVGCISFKKKLNFSKHIIQSQINNSLKNLRSDYIDLVQLYNPDTNDNNLKYTIELLDNLKNQNKINFIGISLGQPADYLKLRKLYKFNTIQCNFNILDQRVKNITPYFTSYTISKSGLYTLTKSLALNLAPNIRVNGISPGPTLKSKHQSSQQFKKQISKTPLQKQVSLDEINLAIDYLIYCKSVTGEVLTIDSGQSLGWANSNSKNFSND